MQKSKFLYDFLYINNDKSFGGIAYIKIDVSCFHTKRLLLALWKRVSYNLDKWFPSWN